MCNSPIPTKNFVKLSQLSAGLSESELLLESLKKYRSTVMKALDVTPGSVNDIGEDITILENRIDQLKIEREKELATMELFISSITDPRSQTYMRLHYIRGLSWEEVAAITEATSAGVVMANVQSSISAAQLKKGSGEKALPRKLLSDFSKLSADLSKKEHTLKAFSHCLPHKTSEIAPEDVAELEAEIDNLRSVRAEKLIEIEAFISGVKDPLVQVYMRLHYIRGMKWADVAKLTHATSANAVRTRVLRYISLRSKAARLT